MDHSIRLFSFSLNQRFDFSLHSLANIFSTGSSTTGETPKSGKSLSEDFVQLSPLAQIKSALDKFSLSQNEKSLTLDLQAKQGDFLKDQLDSKSQSELELILRMLSGGDDEEYKKLKESFQNFFSQTKISSTSSTNISTASSTNVTENFKENNQPVNTSSAENDSQLRAEFLRAVGKFKTSTTNLLFRNRTTPVDPLVVDLKGDGVKLTSVEKGAVFDINGDGKQEKTSWVEGDTAILAMDRDGDGKITSGKEFFGDQNGAKNGFEELSKFDDNKDGVIDSKDRVFKALKLYKDLNGDKKIESNELFTLGQLGIKKFNLKTSPADETISGNSITLKGSFTTKDGKTGDLADAFFQTKK
ncbi:MAG: hypothetical protein HQM08_02725 [Candidatus Riflebacteria bacterium]|nr:hypothetical protein [Candidatus Riflebacteria bacterium]